MYLLCRTCRLYKAVAVEHRRLKLNEDVAKLFELYGIDDRFEGSVWKEFEMCYVVLSETQSFQVLYCSHIGSRN